MILIKENGFIDFDPALSELAEKCKDEIKSLLRHGGFVNWDDGHPLITTASGYKEVTIVTERKGTVYVTYSINRSTDFMTLNDLLLNDLVAVYEAVFDRVREIKAENDADNDAE